MFYAKILIHISFIIITLISNIVFADISYDIVHVPEQKKMQVTVEFKGNSKGESILVVPIEQKIEEKYITRISIFDKNIQFVNDSHMHFSEIKVRYPPNANVKFQYDINNKANHSLNPLIMEDFFYFNGSVLIVVKEEPENCVLNIHSPVINLFIRNISDNDNKLVEYSDHITISNNKIWELVNKVYIGGSTKNTHMVNMSIQDHTIDMVFLNFKELPVELMKNIKNIYIAQYNIFNNIYDKSKFLSIIINTKKHIGLSNGSFSVQSNKLDSIGHEHMHIWLNNIQYESIDPIFQEGFSDYYSSKTNYIAKTISKRDYVNQYNLTLENYSKDIAYYIPHSEMQNYNDYHYENYLCYERGNILAQELDSRIQEYTNNKYSLDDVMRHIVEQAKNKRTILDVSTMKLALKDVVGNSFDEVFDFILENTNLLKLNPNALGKDYKITFKNFIVSDFGFDVVRSHLQKKIVGIDKNSPAYKAGLRDNQEYMFNKSVTKKNKDGSSTVDIDIVEGKKNKNIKFKTKMKVIEIPQYELISVKN